MSLTNFTGTVTAALLRSNFDDATATLATNAIAGQKDHTVSLRTTTLADTTALSLRTIAFVANDDYEVRVFAVRNTDTTAGRVITGTLTVDGTTSTTFLGENTVSISVTSVNGTVDSRTDYRTTTGTRIRLIKGVRYRLTLANGSAGTTTGVTIVMLQLRTVRRAA